LPFGNQRLGRQVHLSNQIRKAGFVPTFVLFYSNSSLEAKGRAKAKTYWHADCTQQAAYA